MSSINPSNKVKAEIVYAITKLLGYGVDMNQYQIIQINAEWDKENLKIQATLDRLVKFLTPETHSRSLAQQKNHLRYILIEILQKQLQILIDERHTNEFGNYQGIREWKFTLKFWYPATTADYITLNLQAFDRHWNHTYQITTTIEPPRQNLPPRRHSQFIGHQTEFDRIFNLLTTERQQIISIEGMAGVGKTTLALEVAYQCLTQGKFTTIIFSSAQSQLLEGSHLARRFRAERNLRDLLEVIFKTLDSSDDRPSDIEAQIHSICELLADRSTLIIVDNIETLTDQTDTIEFLLNLPPTVKIILTSRVRLGIGGVVNLEPLSVNESIELIQHQAQQKNLPIQTSSQIKLICRNTRGLPLAINYLMGLLSITGSPILEEPLADTNLALYCFERVVNELRAIPDSIAYQLLLSLSLFPDGASTAALTYISGGKPITPGLQQLDRSCLVWAIAPERYQIHSLTQEYAQLELNKERELAGLLRNRWQNWYLELVAPFGSLDWQDWQDYSSIAAEWKNLRLVVDWCIEQERYLEVRQFWQCLKGFTLLGGRWLQRQRWLEWLQDAAVAREDLPTIAELKYQHSFTLAFIDQSDGTGKAIELALEAWEMHQHLQSDRQFELVMYIASLYIRKLPQENTQAVNLELSTRWIDRGLEMLALLPTNHPRYHRHQFQVYYYQAEIQLLTGQLSPAYDLYFQANQSAKKAHWQRFIHYTSGLMAIILTKQGEFTRAERRLMTVLKYTDKYGDARAGTLCLKHLAEVKKAKGDFIAARAFTERAKSGFKRLHMTIEFKMMEQFLQTLDV